VTLAGIVLCGGQSRRMGQPKAWLRFGEETLLERVVRVIGTAAAPVVVVAAEGQPLPPLPTDVHVLRDPVANQGPLAGIATALSFLAMRGATASHAYVASTDTPLLDAAFIRALHELCGKHDAAIAETDGHLQPLGAVYRIALHQTATELLAAGERRLLSLPEACDTRRVDKRTLLENPALARRDPELTSLFNINAPADYERALQELGLER